MNFILRAALIFPTCIISSMSEFLELGVAIRRYTSVWRLLAVSSGVSVGFYIVGVLATHSGAYWYLVWNLFLAWLPLVFAAVLVIRLRSQSWGSWPGIVLTLLWLIFLPNSFYIVSDFIHLSTQSVNVLFTAVMFLSFALNGLVLGFLSLWLVHCELLKRFRARSAHELVGVILLLTSFAIYLGRKLALEHLGRADQSGRRALRRLRSVAQPAQSSRSLHDHPDVLRPPRQHLLDRPAAGPTFVSRKKLTSKLFSDTMVVVMTTRAILTSCLRAHRSLVDASVISSQQQQRAPQESVFCVKKT